MNRCKSISALTAFGPLAILFGNALLYVDDASAQANRPQAELERLKLGSPNDPPRTDPLGVPAGRGSGSELQIELPARNLGHSLKPGMTQNEVEGALGKPDRVEDRPEAIRWYWDKGNKKGWVSFDQQMRKVVEWRSF